jgi:hypothetical protein
MANVVELKAAGAALVELILAVKDGLDAGDLIPAQALLSAVLAAADDIQEDWDSAALDIVAGAIERVAEVRRQPEVP